MTSFQSGKPTSPLLPPVRPSTHALFSPTPRDADGGCASLNTSKAALRVLSKCTNHLVVSSCSSTFLVLVHSARRCKASPASAPCRKYQKQIWLAHLLYAQYLPFVSILAESTQPPNGKRWVAVSLRPLNRVHRSVNIQRVTPLYPSVFPC